MEHYRDDPLATLQSIHREFGDMAVSHNGPVAIYMFFHPDQVREVLVEKHRSFMKGPATREARRLLGDGLLTSEDPFHRRQRKMIQPIFYRERLDAYAAAMVAEADRACAAWHAGKSLDLHEEMVDVTLHIVARTLLDADLADEANEIGAALTAAMHEFARLRGPFAGATVRAPISAVVRSRRARDVLDALIYRLIEERRGHEADRTDLLSMLMSAVDEEGGGLTGEQVRDEAMTLFLAGHETTANALTWTWYLLSKNPEVEARLFAEVDDVLGGRAPAASDLPGLAFTERVLTESMRLFPPVWKVGRLATEDVTIGGVDIPEGAMALLSQFVTHRDERWWPDPERFDPDRFAEEHKGERPLSSYFPFGGGSRTCIGEGFSRMEGTLLLAAIARDWRFELDRTHEVVPLPLVTLRPREGLPATAHRR